MIVTLVCFLIVVVFMAFFIGFNIGENCNLWFFKTFEGIPVSVLVLLSFAAGIVFSLLLLTIYKLRKSSTANEVEKLADEKSKNDKRNLKLREKTEKKIRKLQKQSVRAKNIKPDLTTSESQSSSTDSPSTDK